MKKILILLGVGLLLSSCAAAVIGTGAAAVGTGVAVGTDDRGGSGVVDDQDLASSAKDIASAVAPKGSYTIAAYQGQVLLAGQVPNNYELNNVATAVAKTHGAKGVYNYLTVSPNQSFGQMTTDTYLTTAAKSRLIAQKDVNTNNIKVVTCNGVVYLMGAKVGDGTQVAGAIQGINQIDGVKKTVNLLQ